MYRGLFMKSIKVDGWSVNVPIPNSIKVGDH